MPSTIAFTVSPIAFTISKILAQVAIHCINHAIEWIDKFHISLDESGNRALQDFLNLRKQLCLCFPTCSASLLSTSGENCKQSNASRSLTTTSRSHFIRPEEVLNAEADAMLDIAEDELKEGLKKSAARNFHAASVFYKVLGMFWLR